MNYYVKVYTKELLTDSKLLASFNAKLAKDPTDPHYKELAERVEFNIKVTVSRIKFWLNN